MVVPALAQPRIPGLPGRARNAPNTAPGQIAYNRDFYDSLKNYAEGLYKQKERQDFKLRVDRGYEELLRAHAERAFQTNVSPHSEIRFILEDRFRIFTGLYDNLMIQDAVNRIGQEVAPKWSEKLVTFKLIADPVPKAEALATGTVYVTTGLVAAMENKAQLAYVLAHEAAHVAKEHWKLRSMIENAKEEYSKAKVENQKHMELYGSLVGLGVGAAIGGVTGRTVQSAALGGAIGTAAGFVLSGGLTAATDLNISWNEFEEDEADEVALQSMLDSKIDVRQVPVLYLAMDKMAMKDDRVGMGFWGNRTRMQERLEVANEFLAKNVKDGAGLTGTDPEFKRLVAELKRDNGILSFHNDMLDVARSNLEQAVEVRDADPTSLYYYGKILKATARTDEDQKKAIEMFARALQRDSANYAYGAYLHRATALIEKGSAADKKQAAELLEQYLDHYAQARRETRGRSEDLPPHMDTIVDYMRRAGFENWRPGTGVKTAVREVETPKPTVVQTSAELPLAGEQPKPPAGPKTPAAKQQAPKKP